MLNYDSAVTSQRKWMLYLLAILFLGAGFTPYPRIFLGLILGSTVSFYNMWLLQRKVQALGKAVANNTKMSGIGTISRVAASVLVVLIALQYEEIFHFYSVVIGLTTSYFIMMIDFFVRSVIDALKS